jgi:hypothetical protein
MPTDCNRVVSTWRRLEFTAECVAESHYPLDATTKAAKEETIIEQVTT